MKLPRLPHTRPSCACTRAVSLCNDTTGTHPPRGPPSPGTRLSLYFPAHKFISWESAGQLAWGPREDEGHWILQGSARSTGESCEAFINGSRSSREGHDCGEGFGGRIEWTARVSLEASAALSLGGANARGGECFCCAWYSELWMGERILTRHLVFSGKKWMEKFLVGLGGVVKFRDLVFGDCEVLWVVGDSIEKN